MSQIAIAPPETTEYAPYYGRYVSLVGGNDILAILETQGRQTAEVLSGLSEEQGKYRYAPEKWSVKEVLGHVNDTERIFAYRVLRISRNDKTPIEGFEQDDYVRYGPFGHCRLSELVEEFGQVRACTLSLLRKLDDIAWMRRGTASNKEVSVRALAYIIAGHELHHMNVLKEKYLR